MGTRRGGRRVPTNRPTIAPGPPASPATIDPIAAPAPAGGAREDRLAGDRWGVAGGVGDGYRHLPVPGDHGGGRAADQRRVEVRRPRRSVPSVHHPEGPDAVTVVVGAAVPERE